MNAWQPRLNVRVTAAETLKAHTRVFLVSQDSLRAMRAYVSVGMRNP